MPKHESVPTTCTASMITGWDLPGILDPDPKVVVNKKLQVVDSLISQGYKRDFSILFAITTDTQVTRYGLDTFMPKLGFQLTFVGPKASEGSQRHKETGDLTMWSVKPEDYETALKAYKKELTAIKEEIDPPKKPDPARQKFPDLLLSHLRKKGIVKDNASVDNPIIQILEVDEDKAWAFIRLGYGIDIRKFKGLGTGWTKITTRQLKTFQREWKAELI